MSDLFAFDLDDGLVSGHCALCYALSSYMLRWLRSFWAEGWRTPEARDRFLAGGGFCARHLWLIRDVDPEYRVAVGDIYGELARRDIAALTEALTQRRKRRGSSERLRLRIDCAACLEETTATGRKVDLILEMVASSAGRDRYARSSAVCYQHLLNILESADEQSARFLLDDWRRRLTQLRNRLLHFDRTRDHRYAAQRTADDERACRDVLRYYLGSAR